MYKHITKGMYVGVIEKDIKSKDKGLNDLNILYKKYT